MTSVVMIGRRTKGSVRLISPEVVFSATSGFWDSTIVTLAPGETRSWPLVTTSSPGFRPSVTMVMIADSASDFHLPDLGGVAGNDKDLGSLLAFHDRGCGHSQGVWFIGELDGYIDELAWPKSVILHSERWP